MSLFGPPPERANAYLEKRCEACRGGPVRWKFVPDPYERPRGPGISICSACGHESTAWPSAPKAPVRLVTRRRRA